MAYGFITNCRMHTVFLNILCKNGIEILILVRINSRLCCVIGCGYLVIIFYVDIENDFVMI